MIKFFEDSGNQRSVTTLQTEGAQMGRIGSGTLSGDLDQAVLVNPSRPLNWNLIAAETRALLSTIQVESPEERFGTPTYQQ